MNDKPVIYTDAYYNRLFEVEERHWWNLGMKEIAQSVIRSELSWTVPGTPRRVLDAGCGSGASLLWLEEFAAGGPVLGIDLSADALRYSRSRGRARLARASAYELPIRSGSIDLVISVDVFQHLPRRGADRRALDEVFRALAPGGLFFLRTNFAAPGRRNRADFVDFHFYTEPEVRGLFEAAGFVRIRSSPVNVVVDGAGRLRACLREWLGQPGGPANGPGLPEVPPRRSTTRRALLELLRFEARWLGHGRRLPFGGSLVITGRKPA